MNNKYKQILIYSVISLVFSIFLEIFIFNYGHFVSLFYPKSQQLDFVKYSEGMSYYPELNVKLYKYVYEVSDINEKIYNLYLDIEYRSDADIQIYLTDEANQLLYDANSHHISPVVEKSNYIKINTSGKSEKIKLEVLTQNEMFNIKDIYINHSVPILFNVLRFSFCFIIMIFVFCLKKYSLFSDSFDEYKYKWILILVLAFISFGIYIFIMFSSMGQVNLVNSEHQQYALLARSLKQGKFSIDLNVSEELKSLKNPYDFYYRESQLTRNVDYYLDYAYYKEKYYSYFGVVPCVLMYLPYHIITGQDLNNSIPLLISCSLYVCASFYIIYQIFKKYFSKATFKWYLLFSLLLSLCSGLAYIIRIGHFYGIPITMGAAFAMLGLGLWINASQEKQINTKKLLLGSICMALVAGCRPQLLLTSFLIFPIFAKHIKSKEAFKLKNVICLSIPYVIVAALLMYYNYARFGSVIDFGANYNLTSNDMTKRGFVLGRTGLGIFSFLFEFPKITVIFPFIDYYNIISSYHGITITEGIAGGFFALNSLGLINLFVFKLKKLFKEKSLYNFALSCLCFALIIVVADTQMAGIIQRYICDFGFLITISTVIITMTILNNYKGNIKLLKKIVTYIILFSIFYNFLVYFTDSLRTVDSVYTNIYYYFYYLFMFWL